jgi:hypothetical protein
MDPYDGEVLGKRFDPQYEPVRRNLGHVLRLSRRLDLTKMKPHDGLASTKFCLADPGTSYIVYLPKGGKTTVDLRKAGGSFGTEWIDASTGKSSAGKSVEGGAIRNFTAPSKGDAVLHLSRSSASHRR